MKYQRRTRDNIRKWKSRQHAIDRFIMKRAKISGIVAERGIIHAYQSWPQRTHTSLEYWFWWRSFDNLVANGHLKRLTAPRRRSRLFCLPHLTPSILDIIGAEYPQLRRIAYEFPHREFTTDALLDFVYPVSRATLAKELKRLEHFGYAYKTSRQAHPHHRWPTNYWCLTSLAKTAILQ